ncbi:MAG: hypothetical protein KKB74_06750 [Bacteroidetes bacterium]|nr:hypothetical protein [Bacteroidota bacterium]
MRFFVFKTPKPKSFTYIPRYYDPDKLALEQKKAAMGLDSTLTHNEQIRLQMSRRWRRSSSVKEGTPMSKVITYAIYATLILGSVYLIMFTDFIERLLSAFGVTH